MARLLTHPLVTSPIVGANSVEQLQGLVSSPERLCMAQVDQDPVGFILAASAGGPRLDEFGTIEGKSWPFIGPTCVPEREGKGIEKGLLDWLIAYARETGIARLIRFAREISLHEHVSEVLEEAGFRERLRYYYMRLEMFDAIHHRNDHRLASSEIEAQETVTWSAKNDLILELKT